MGKRTKSQRMIGIAAVALMLATACGGSGKKPSGGTGSTPPGPLTLTYHDEAGPGPAAAIQEIMVNVKYKVSDIKTKPGRFVVHLVNQEDPPKGATCLGNSIDVCYSHEMKITDQSDKTLAVSATIAPGKDSVFVIDNLPAGTYPFYCSLKDHLARGMKGSITVEA